MRIKITRLEPLGSGQREPYTQTYELDVVEGMTVLETLIKIAEELDQTLSFRSSCRSSICGSCALEINGIPMLACRTQILPEYEKGSGGITIAPLSNHRVIKDLVIDLAPFWEKINSVAPYLTPCEGFEDIKMTKEDGARIHDSQKCIMCGACNSACNALDIDKRFIGPAALAKAWRIIGDAREGRVKQRLEALSLSHGVWDCVRCAHCTEYCPKEVAPLEKIERLRSRAIEQDVTENHGARHAIAMAESIKRVGRLDEAAMTFKTLGFLRSLGMVPFGMKMELHGKMPHPILFPAIEGIDEVRKLFLEWEKEKKREKRRNSPCH
ncbi:MAG: 4Fe-4S dicluster domain-containing protein [Deltaproteobacteria bacterium]|nr:4Fe-4S dicluster domain-containing protein [Deltaproteobacteria bacterium]